MCEFPSEKSDKSSNHCVKSVQIRSFFWSVFCHIRTEYGEIRSISPYSGRMRENSDQEKLRIWTLFTPCNLYCKFCIAKMSHICQKPWTTKMINLSDLTLGLPIFSYNLVRTPSRSVQSGYY